MKVTLSVSTNRVGSRVQEAVDLTEEDGYVNEDGTLNEAAVNEFARDWLFNQIDWGWVSADDATK